MGLDVKFYIFMSLNLEIGNINAVF